MGSTTSATEPSTTADFVLANRSARTTHGTAVTAGMRAGRIRAASMVIASAPTPVSASATTDVSTSPSTRATAERVAVPAPVTRSALVAGAYVQQARPTAAERVAWTPPATTSTVAAATPLAARLRPALPANASVRTSSTSSATTPVWILRTTRTTAVAAEPAAQTGKCVSMANATALRRRPPSATARALRPPPVTPTAGHAGTLASGNSRVLAVPAAVTSVSRHAVRLASSSVTTKPTAGPVETPARRRSSAPAGPASVPERATCSAVESAYG